MTLRLIINYLQCALYAMSIRPEGLRKTLSNLRQESSLADIKMGLDMNSGLLGNTNLFQFTSQFSGVRIVQSV
jgi:hypothetical protein